MRALLRLLGLGLIGLAVFVIFAPALEPMAATEATAVSPPPTRANFAALPPTAPEAGRSLLERSPFAQDRSAFDPEASMAPPPPPVEVRLTGIFRMGGELRASLMIGGQSFLVKEGEDTPAGKVGKIEANAVVLQGPPERRAEMFRQ